MKKMGRVGTDQISGLFWFLLGGYVTYESRHYGLGTLTSPGPGFLLFYSGLGLMGLSVLVIASEAMRSSKPGLSSLWSGLQWWRPLFCWLSLLAYAFVVGWLGFLLTTFSLMVYLFSSGRSSRRIIAVPMALATVAIAYLLFQVLLQCQLPAGLLWR